VDTQTLLFVLLGVIVVTLVFAATLVVPGRRRRGTSEAAEPPAVGVPEGGADPDARAADGTVGADEPSPGLTATATTSPVLERPDEVAGRLRRLRARLARSGTSLGRGLLVLLSRDTMDDAAWDEIEDTLITADMGVAAAQELVQALRTRVRVEGLAGEEQLAGALREELLRVVDPTLDRTLAIERHDDVPAVVLVVGVNGTGKTTTTGKLARVLVAEDKDVLLGAADTFRAAAAQQLTTWGDRIGVPTVSREEGADPASVAFEAVAAGVDAEVDVVLIDTAGRLHTKAGLMDELGKVRRVIEKKAPVTEVLLVLDATTGQNGLTQAKVFTDAVDVTGVVLTKLDGTAKGGIVLAVQRELGIPVKLVGLGEGPDDLAPFDAADFVDALLTPTP
jgi:fused signal recognition particle receptor